jgi:hypothetical protein
MEQPRYSWLEYAIARLLAPFAPTVLRLTYRRLPTIDGMHVLVCTPTSDTASAKLANSLALLRQKAPRRWKELCAHVLCIHVDAQRERHGRFDTRLRSLRFDRALLDHQRVEAVAGFLALGSFAASMYAQDLSVRKSDARHPGALRTATKHVLESLGVTFADPALTGPAA